MQLNRGCLNLECLEGTILVKWVILRPLGGLFFFIWLYANNFEQNSEGKRKTANVNKLIKHSTTDVYCMWTVFILFGGFLCVCADSCGIFFNLKLKKKLLCYIRSWSEYCGIFLWRAFFQRFVAVEYSDSNNNGVCKFCIWFILGFFFG